MIKADCGLPDSLRDESGVALPLALLGLIAVTLMVTGILLTSSTEVAISGAHQDATSALYDVEGALQQYVGQQSVAAAHPRLSTGNASITSSSGETFDIAVSQLAEATSGPDGAGVFRRSETFSILATPSDNRGRSVGSLIEVIREANSVSLDIDAGLTLGANTTITGNATISDRSALCDSAAATSAITYGSDVDVDIGGSANVEGDTTEAGMTSDELMTMVLNGNTIDELAARANIKFGPQFGTGTPDFNNSIKPNGNAADPMYQWGCPAVLVSSCDADDASYFPVVAIDASGAGTGGEVVLNGDHGQGTLIILNGDLRMEGNFQYKGIVLVEGVTQIKGTPRIEGALVAMGDQAVIDPNDDGTSTGNSVVRFNKCEILNAQAGLTAQALDAAEQRFESNTFAWFEVVR